MSLQPGRNNVLDFTRLVIFVELDPGEFWRHWVKVIFELDLSDDFAQKTRSCNPSSVSQVRDTEFWLLVTR